MGGRGGSSSGAGRVAPHGSGGAKPTADRDKNRFVTKVRTVKRLLTKANIAKLQAKFDTGSDVAKYIYDVLIPNGGVVAHTSQSKAFFSSSEMVITWDGEAQVLNGWAGTAKEYGDTWYHEHGHYISWLFQEKLGYKVEDSPALAQAFEKDMTALSARMQRWATKNKKTYSSDLELAKDFTKTRIPIETGGMYSGIQDIIGGYYQKQFGWGHTPKYWKDWASIKGQYDRVSHTIIDASTSQVAMMEGVAHMFGAQFNPNARLNFQTYFPTTLRTYEGILSDVARGLKNGTIKTDALNPDGSYAYVDLT